jgi:hypothetical protein
VQDDEPAWRRAWCGIRCRGYSTASLEVLNGPMAGGLALKLRWQASACAELGSRFYGVLLGRLADDAEAGGPTARVLAGHEDDPVDSLVSLRLLGGVHRRVLLGLEPLLAVHYPSVGGDGDAEAALEPFLDTLDANAAELRGALARPPQTNEVGRAAPLVGALWHLQSIAQLPVRLFEIGASGGLNLLADHFRFEGAGATGPADSPVVFEDAWLGNVPATRPLLDVVERLGCDRDPVDASTDEGALTLTSYVWPDQAERLARLRGALALVRANPVTVVARSAAEFVGDLTREAGTWTVLWHSVMWQYLEAREQDDVVAHLERLGAIGGDDAPLARISFEPRLLAHGEDIGFVVTVWTWPGGVERVLGRAPAHGLPVEWS